MYQKAIQKAENIIRHFSIKKAPIPVEDIVAQLGIYLSYAASTKYSGTLIKKGDGKALMGINSNEPLVRRRYTIAHELGHYFLDNDKITIEYRNKEKDVSKNLKEKEADVFAANLLIPESFVKKDFEVIAKRRIFLENDLIKLSEDYQVSKEAMYWRLVNLKYIVKITD